MPEKFSNFHTHTILCDGKDWPEELVLEALRLGAQKLPITTKFIVRRDYVETTI